MRRLSGFVVLLVLTSGAYAPDASAAGPDPETDRFNVSLGTYVISFDTTAQLSPASGAGTAVDLESILGLDNRRTDVRLDGYWRFSRRHRIDVGYFLDSRNGLKAIDEDVVWGDVTYDVGAEIESKFSTQYLKTVYRFAFLRDDRAEVGLSAGFATMRLEGELAGNGTVSESEGRSEIGFFREAKNVIAPVPVVGLYGSFVIRDGLFFRPSFEFFSIDTNGLNGSLVDARATLDWFFAERWGVGLGFNRVRVEYEETSGDPRMNVSSSMGGAVLYVSYAF